MINIEKELEFLDSEIEEYEKVFERGGCELYRQDSNGITVREHMREKQKHLKVIRSYLGEQVIEQKYKGDKQ